MVYMTLINFVTETLSLLNNPIALIKAAGTIGLVCIIFAETGLLFGFFLPGDSLLVSAGLLAATGHLSMPTLLISLSTAAIVGDALGFYIGQKLGPVLYTKKDSFFFRKKHLELAQEFYLKHGGKTILFARFIPIIRTFAPTVAGAAKMNYLRFAIFNVVGGIGWVFSTLFAGYYLAKIIGPKVQDYIHYVIIIIILLSVAPLGYKWLTSRKAS